MTEEGYNGWRDRATWALNLHWSNEQDLYRRLAEVAREAIFASEDLDTATAIVREYLRDDLDDRVGTCSDLLVRDLVATPDFHEVAVAWVRDVDEMIDSEPKFRDCTDLVGEYRTVAEDDSWGDCLMALFAVCDELYFRQHPAPSESWGYEPGAPYIGGDPRQRGTYWFDVLREAETDALVSFGHLLARYRGMLKHAGRDY